MRVPERELLAAVSGIEAVVDVEDIAVRRPHPRREPVDERLGEARRVRPRRRILEAADGRLRGERRTALRVAPDRHLQRGIVAQRIVVDGVLVAAADAEGAGRDDFEERVANAGAIAPVAPSGGESRDNADLPLGGSEQQHARVGRLVAAVEGDCEFLARDGWQVEGKRRSVRHGCGVPVMNAARRLDTDLLRDLSALRHSHARLSHD